MRAEQPPKLCKPCPKTRVKVGDRKTGLTSLVIITGRPKTVLSLLFHLFYVRCC